MKKSYEALHAKLEEQGLIDNGELFEITTKASGVKALCPGGSITTFYNGQLYEFVHVGKNNNETVQKWHKVQEKLGGGSAEIQEVKKVNLDEVLAETTPEIEEVVVDSPPTTTAFNLE